MMLSLLEAVQANDIQATIQLLEDGADPNVFDASSKVSALGIAAFRGNGVLCRLLLKHGAEWKTSDGGVSADTAVDDAMRGGHTYLAEYLRKRLAQDQAAQAEAEAGLRREMQDIVAARKAAYAREVDEHERALRGVKVAHQLKRAAKNQDKACCTSLL